MLKLLKHSLLNLFWYNKVRSVPGLCVDNPESFYSYISKCKNGDITSDGCIDIKLALTNMMLNSVGLMVSDKPIPNYVYLSPIQKQSITKANQFGHKVGLLVKDK